MSGPEIHRWLWYTAGAVGFLAGTATLVYRRAFGFRTWFALGLAFDGLVLGAHLQYRIENFPTLDAALNVPLETLLGGPMRLPLGFLVGGVLAGLWCVVTRARWRDAGDAIAVAWSVMIPIGRVGCMFNGCCMGSVCGTWMTRICPRYPQGTEAFERQLHDGLVTMADPWSLPAHPLPVYFGLASLATLWILVGLLRRDAERGSLMATFCVIRPFTKFTLEHIRALPRRGDMMFWIPLVSFLFSSGVVLGIWWYRRSARRALGEVRGTEARA